MDLYVTALDACNHYIEFVVILVWRVGEECVGQGACSVAVLNGSY